MRIIFFIIKFTHESPYLLINVKALSAHLKRHNTLLSLIVSGILSIIYSIAFNHDRSLTVHRQVAKLLIVMPIILSGCAAHPTDTHPHHAHNPKCAQIESAMIRSNQAPQIGVKQNTIATYQARLQHQYHDFNCGS